MKEAVKTRLKNSLNRRAQRPLSFSTTKLLQTSDGNYFINEIGETEARKTKPKKNFHRIS